jgi:hypothetical protein
MASSGTDELAGRLRRWIVVGGCILGGWAILQNAFMLLAWGPTIFARYFPYRVLVPVHRLSVMLWLAAPMILLAGCWGFHRHRPWARPVLLTYAAAAVAGLIGTQAVHFIDILTGGHRGLTYRQALSSAVSQLDLVIYASVFPAFVLLSLGRPEVRDTFPEFRPGFAPVIDHAQGK